MSIIFCLLVVALLVNTSSACPAGYWDERGICTPCPQGKYQPQPGQTECIDCPTKTWTVAKGAALVSDCIGPTMIVCDGVNFTGKCLTFHDRLETKLHNIMARPRSMEIVAGAWNFQGGSSSWLFRPPYLNRIPDLNENRFDFADRFEALPEDYFCFSSDKPWLYHPSRYYNATDDGRPCMNWKQTEHPEIGEHNYCAWVKSIPNVAQKTKPWCYTRALDSSVTWRYCNVPVCTWNTDYCYIRKGWRYHGHNTITRNGYTCQNWQSNFPHPHPWYHELGDHNYARWTKMKYFFETIHVDAEAPWCYTTSLLHVWDYTSTPQCNASVHTRYYEDAGDRFIKD